MANTGAFESLKGPIDLEGQDYFVFSLADRADRE
jgi:hypothetical protein